MQYIVPKESQELAAQGLGVDCNVIAGGVTVVATKNIRDVGLYNGNYSEGNYIYGVDPLALVTRQNDPVWSAFVYWIVSALFYAEEINFTNDVRDLPLVYLFGSDYQLMFRHTVQAVGSFANIYEKNLQADFPRSGLNLLNRNPPHAQLYPLPIELTVLRGVG